MEADLKDRIDSLEKKLDAIYISAEKTRRYFLIVLVITLVAFVLPLIGLVFAIPAFISSYAEMLTL